MKKARTKSTRNKRILAVAIGLSAGLVVLFCGLLIFINVFFPVRYKDIILNQAAIHQVDSRLIFAVVWTESRFNSKALSRKGAKGLMQLLPTTARWCAEKMDIEYDEARLFEPEFNIALGVFYLRYLIDKFGEEAAVAAYNAGEGNIKKWGGEIKYRETRDFVRRVRFARLVYGVRLINHI